MFFHREAEYHHQHQKVVLLHGKTHLLLIIQQPFFQRFHMYDCQKQLRWTNL